MDVISVVRLQTKAIGKTAAAGDNVFSELVIVFRNGLSQIYTQEINKQCIAGYSLDSLIGTSNAGMTTRSGYWARSGPTTRENYLILLRMIQV
jgi:hypothetical protein